MKRRSMFLNKLKLSLAAVSISFLFLSGCGPEYFDKAYDGAKKAAGMAAGAVSEVSPSEAAQSAKDKVSEIAKDSGLMTPDELVDGIVDFLNPSQNASGASNSVQNGSDGKSADEWQKDDSWGGNSADRGVYDEAFADRHESGELTEVEMCRVVDGDTIVVCYKGSYSYVRLIGINTPESVAPDEYLEKTGKENTQEGKDASSHSKELLSGVKAVWLEFDEEEYDPYERILAYVWLSTDRTDLMNMLNARILADGYAEPMSIKPNTRYATEFAALVDDGK